MLATRDSSVIIAIDCRSELRTNRWRKIKPESKERGVQPQQRGRLSRVEGIGAGLTARERFCGLMAGRHLL